MNKRLLLVDDDALMRRSLAFNLEQNGYQVKTAGSAEEAFQILTHYQPALVLLDIGLPGMDGLEALRLFRDQYHLPVILITARRRELDEILGLELGADDYITKPFNFDIVLAHVKTVLRRIEQTNQPNLVPKSLVVGELQIDSGAHVVTIRGQRVELSPREFDLLYYLALEAGRVVSVNDLIVRVWGAEFLGESQVVYVHMRWLREKIEVDPNHPQKLVTVRGVGYMLVT